MKVTLLDGIESKGGVEHFERPMKEKPPTAEKRAVENAHHAKVHATDSWVRGEINSKKHSEIHKRADQVIKKKGHM